MLRKEGDGGRRPLLLGNNRQMLQEIRDSLRHLQKQNQNQGDNTGKPEPMQIKADLSQSTPNLVEKMGNGGKNMSRLGYNQKAMAEIRQSLANYQIVDEASAGLHHIVVPNGLDELTPVKGSLLRQLMAMGWDEEVASRALKISGNKSVDAALDTIQKLSHHEGKNGFAKVAASGLQSYSTKVIRKPSFEEKYRGQSSPVNSENSSVRSESPSMSMQRQYMEPPRLANTQPNLTVPTVNQPMAFPGDRQTPPPPLPPRGVPPAQTPPPPPLPPNAMSNEACSGAYQQHMLTPGHVQQMIRRMSPGQRDPNSRLQGAGMAYLSQPHTPGSSGPVTPQRGMSPVLGRQQYPHNAGLQNMTAALGLQLTEDAHGRPVVLTGSQMARIPLQYGYPPPYTQLLPNKSSPTLPVHEQSHMIVSQVQGNSSPLSSHSPSPGPMHSPGQPGPQMQIHVQPGQNHQLGSHSPGQGQLNSGPRPAAMQAWNAKQQPIIMQQVKSREVQKPVLQTATAPMSPLQPQQSPQNYISSVQAQVNTPPSQQSVYPQQCMGYQQPFGNFQIEITRQSQSQGVQNYTNCNSGPQGPGRTIQIHINNHGPNSVQIQQSLGCGRELVHQPHWQRNYNIETPDTTPRSGSPVSRALNQSPMSVISTVSTPSTNSDIPDKPPPPYPGKITHQVQSYGMHDPNAFHHNMVYPHGDTQRIDETSGQVRGPADAPADSDQQSNLSEPVEEVEGKRLCSSPKPERKPEARKKDAERRETKVPVYSPQAFKFFMEQHVENLLKSHQQRMHRKNQLETEMAKVGLSEEAQTQMRKMLHQKESNYIRLKRAKMDKTMFGKIKTLGIGAFGEVALVHKKDTGHLYAMKTLCKNDVLQRNQAAHVKAERDILAEADNEWVVKLYYSFQDKDNLYFVMDYIPGGDMMSLLIKLGIFKESLAQFYIAELVLAIESVHKMGFIHRDIKPDNILIDRDGHIKLTDFGLCTGFRWTHNSKYYQKGNHMRQDSMEPDENWGGQSCHCSKELLKPLERRKLRHQRCLAHSLVGTPNYIAPEVLLRSGYTSCCDWWSVGVILYEMLVGQPPFLANTPAETQFKVINWESTLHFPQEVNLSPDATNLILRLCCGPEERLGHNGAVEIKKHPYFHDVPFDTLRRQPAPHAPRIRYPTDTSNFDPVDPDKLKTSASTDSLEEKRDGPYENGKHPDHAFFEFTFRRFFDDGGHAYATKLKDPETNAPVYV